MKSLNIIYLSMNFLWKKIFKILHIQKKLQAIIIKHIIYLYRFIRLLLAYLYFNSYLKYKGITDV